MVKIQDKRESGSPLETLGVGIHCPGSIHEVSADVANNLLATNPNFKRVEVKKTTKKTTGKKKLEVR